VIGRDMLSLGKLSQEDLLNIHSVLLLIARSGIEGCSYSSISKNVGITKYMARQYIGMMDSASLLKVVMPYGANVIQELKILLNPGIRLNLSQGVDPDRLTGAIREEFFIHHIFGTGLVVNYLKSIRGQKLPDYILFYDDRKLIFEIGGAGKSSAQLKGVNGREKFNLNQPGSVNGIPLILFGFLW